MRWKIKREVKTKGFHLPGWVGFVAGRPRERPSKPALSRCHVVLKALSQRLKQCQHFRDVAVISKQIFLIYQYLKGLQRGAGNSHFVAAVHFSLISCRFAPLATLFL
jgi:hypothetical protein